MTCKMAEDKRGKVHHPNWLINGFHDTVRECNLIDLPLNGYQFTWENRRDSDSAVEERLDRALASEVWLNLFPIAQLSNLLAPVSDHSPLLLCIDQRPVQKHQRKFRFENRWLEEFEVGDVVRSSLENVIHEDVISKLKQCNKDLEAWSKKLNENFRKEANQCKRLLEATRISHDPEDASIYERQR